MFLLTAIFPLSMSENSTWGNKPKSWNICLWRWLQAIYDQLLMTGTGTADQVCLSSLPDEHTQNQVSGRPNRWTSSGSYICQVYLKMATDNLACIEAASLIICSPFQAVSTHSRPRWSLVDRRQLKPYTASTTPRRSIHVHRRGRLCVDVDMA